MPPVQDGPGQPEFIDLSKEGPQIDPPFVVDGSPGYEAQGKSHGLQAEAQIRVLPRVYVAKSPAREEGFPRKPHIEAPGLETGAGNPPSPDPARGQQRGHREAYGLLQRIEGGVGVIRPPEAIQGSFLKRIPHDLQVFRGKDTIRVDQDEVPAGGSVHPEIPGIPRACIGLFIVADRKAVAIRFRHGPGGAFRPILHKDYFKRVPEGLGCQAFQQFPGLFRPVVYGDYYRKKRIHKRS